MAILTKSGTMSTTENLGFAEETFLYVGGSASAPLVINLRDSLLFENPFSGKSVTFIPQIKITSKSDSKERWIDVAGWSYENGYTRGICISVTSDGKIGVFVAAFMIMQNVDIASGVPTQLLPENPVVKAQFRLRVI